LLDNALLFLYNQYLSDNIYLFENNNKANTKQYIKNKKKKIKILKIKNLIFLIFIIDCHISLRIPIGLLYLSLNYHYPMHMMIFSILYKSILSIVNVVLLKNILNILLKIFLYFLRIFIMFSCFCFSQTEIVMMSSQEA